MFKTFMPAALFSLICLALPAHAQEALQSDSEYLQARAVSLTAFIDRQLKAHAISAQQAAHLHVSVGRVQTRAGNLQARNGTVERAEADAMNQTLTDVERVLRGED